MNEKIRELMVNSGFATGYDRTQTGRWILSDKELEKFAELIVQDCINVVEQQKAKMSYGPTFVIEDIKQHFGL